MMEVAAELAMGIRFMDVADPASMMALEGEHFCPDVLGNICNLARISAGFAASDNGVILVISV